jgi:hypothetical protein
MNSQEEKLTVFFKTEYTVHGLTLQRNAILTFEYGGPHDVKVILRVPSAEEEKRGHKPSNPFCSASSCYQVTGGNVKVFRNIIANRILDPALRLPRSPGIEYQTPEGQPIRIPLLPEFPQGFQSLIKTVSGELRDFAFKSVTTLRWRANDLFGRHNPFSAIGLRWSIDQRFWHPAPTDFDITIEAHTPINTSEEIVSYVNATVKSGGNEPLDHDLFREAWAQRHTNPRSALVIGIGAAERAVKRCIGTLVPDAKWLATNLPTPPLTEMIVKYLPKLRPRCDIHGKLKPPPDGIVELLKKGVYLRNRLAHADASPPTYADVNAILAAVRDVLWLLDFYCGFDWAFAFISEDLRT